MGEEFEAFRRSQARFTAAMEALEAAVARQLEARRGASFVDEEIQNLAEDRSRLAEELDRAHGRAARLESAASHVGERLNAAIASISELVEQRRAS